MNVIGSVCLSMWSRLCPFIYGFLTAETSGPDAAVLLPNMVRLSKQRIDASDASVVK